MIATDNVPLVVVKMVFAFVEKIVTVEMVMLVLIDCSIQIIVLASLYLWVHIVKEIGNVLRINVNGIPAFVRAAPIVLMTKNVNADLVETSASRLSLAFNQLD